jgi:hypothetical protein
MVVGEEVDPFGLLPQTTIKQTSRQTPPFLLSLDNPLSNIYGGPGRHVGLIIEAGNGRHETTRAAEVVQG